MHKLKIISFSFFLLLSTISSRAQINTEISFSILDLSSLPLQSLLNFSSANLDEIQTQAGIFINISVNSQQEEVILNGRIEWQSPNGEFSGPAFSFISEPIRLNQSSGSYPYSLIFNNQDFGDGKNVDIAESDDFDGTAIEEIAKLGKLSGIVYFYLSCTDPTTGTIISNEAFQQQIFANDVPNYTILTPTPEQSLNENGFLVQWDQQITSAESFLVVINENSFDSKEDAVAGEPNLNKEFENTNGNLTLVQVSSADLDRDFVDGTSYYLGVFAKIPSIGSGGFEYLPAENSGLQLSIQSTSGSSKAFTNSENLFVDPDAPSNLPSFTFVSPQPATEFSIVFDSPYLSIEWEAVANVTNYEVVINYLSTNSDLLQQARNDNNKTVTPGITIQNTAVSKNNFILSSLPTTQSFADGDYLVISVLANHPSFGKIRSKELLIGKVIKIVGDVTTVMNAEDVEELITNSNLDDAVGVDEDGNSLTGDQLKDILEKIKNGDVQGRVTIIQ